VDHYQFSDVEIKGFAEVLYNEVKGQLPLFMMEVLYDFFCRGSWA
jgi:hypothetical protein